MGRYCSGGLEIDGIGGRGVSFTMAESGRTFMAAWRKEEVDAAKHRQEKKEATRPGKLLSHTKV